MPRINYKGRNLRNLGSDFTFRPGDNDVPDGVWLKWVKHEVIARLCEEGVLSPAKGKPGPKPKATKPADETKPAAPVKSADETKPADEGELSDDDLASLLAGQTAGNEQ